MSSPYQPLAGVTILAWEQAVSLPMATRLLGDLGATVIRVESHARARPRPRYLGNDLARGKLGLALDLRDERGQAAFRRLVRNVDVVCENFTPRVKRGFRLTYDDLRAERPELIMLSLSGYGQTGRWSERPTFGPGIEAASGHARSMGFDDRPPTRPGTVVYADNISGFYAAFAIVTALHRRRATGKGSNIDLAMYEANAFHLALSIGRTSLTGMPESRRGNDDPTALVQDVFPTRDPERWIAVTVRRGQEGALRALVGESDEEALRAWLAGRTAEETAGVLQGAGIAAAPVANARDVLLDPQLRHREAFTAIAHDAPVNGYDAHPHSASPWRFTGHDRPPLPEAPAIGQDTRVVLRLFAGYSDDEIDALLADGVTGEPSGVASPAPRPAPEQVERLIGWRLAAGIDWEPERVLGLRPAGEV